MKKAIRTMLVSLAAVTLLTACASPPQAQVTEAKQMIDSVIAAGGEVFAPEKVASLNKRYEDALAEIKKQDSLTFKNYSLVEFTLNQVMDDCDDLKAKIAVSRGEQVVAVAKRVKFAE